MERGQDPRLVIDNVTYDYQGEYECRAINHINGQERVAVSDPISLQVVGKCVYVCVCVQVNFPENPLNFKEFQANGKIDFSHFSTISYHFKFPLIFVQILSSLSFVN